MGNTNQNKLNSLKSTGPRTEEGKRASSSNSLRHGLTSTHTVVLPTEDAEAYQSHLADYHKTLKPETDRERELVQTLAQTRWRVNRCATIEAGLFTLSIDDQDAEASSPLAAAKAFKASADLFLKLSTYEQRLNRIYQTTKKELDTLQSARAEASKAEMFQAKRIAKFFEENDCPFHPPQFGFVSSNESIDQANLRDLAFMDKIDYDQFADDATPEALTS